MLIIAHRGNMYGPNPEKENKPEYIEAALEQGFDCEIDVWYLNNNFYLGHDFPETLISIDFLQKHEKRLWLHCKHLDSLIMLKDSFNCFFHNKDLYTITSRGFIWGNINSPTHSSVIQVMPEKSETLSLTCYGICTDYPFQYIKIK